MTLVKTTQKQKQVLRLRCAPLRMTGFKRSLEEAIRGFSAVRSHPSGKNRDAVPRPRGYPGAQVGYPAPGMCVASHAVPTGRRVILGILSPGFHPGLFSLAPYGSVVVEMVEFVVFHHFAKNAKGWASGLGVIWGCVWRKIENSVIRITYRPTNERYLFG
jgi:hypothetical protein